MSTNIHRRRFEGRTVLVVGGTTGIGWATAQRIASEGGRVALADLGTTNPEDRVAELPGESHIGVACDVLSQGSVRCALDRISLQVGTLHGLVHVAGGDVAHGDFETIGDETWRLMFELNFLGPVRLLRAAIPLMARRRADPPVEVGAAAVVASRFHGGVVSAAGLGEERCSWPGMIRVVQTRSHPQEGAPFRCPTLPCSSTPARAWTSPRCRRFRMRARCC
ncbi:SDR family NAD(P)-dependent oxidoreductase [Brachybacterium paraconglomeratum]|uniref:SDR family NAD(P)-dependent oxidoreductase n=1 Tax=Brachybacterium paraconglomeratum TaxID=173362 RepID=UPI00358DC2CE